MRSSFIINEDIKYAGANAFHLFKAGVRLAVPMWIARNHHNYAHYFLLDYVKQYNNLSRFWQAIVERVLMCPGVSKDLHCDELLEKIIKMGKAKFPNMFQTYAKRTNFWTRFWTNALIALRKLRFKNML